MADRIGRFICIATRATATFDTTELELSQKVRDVLKLHEGSSKHRRTAA